MDAGVLELQYVTYHPNITIHPECDLASQHARQFAVDLDDLHTMLKTEITEAQCRYQRSADLHQLPAPEFAVGNKVFVKAQFFWMTRLSKKLSKKYLSPYDIIACPGMHSFMLCLPNSMRSVHPVFHVSMLEPTTPNSFPDCSDPPPALEVVDGEPEYKISCIVNSKIDRRRQCKLLYKVFWLGYKGTDQEFNWLPAIELEYAPELIMDFHAAYPDKPGPLANL
jgi:hypothetical protein